MEVREEGDYIPNAVTTRMTAAHINVSLIVSDKVTRQCPLKRKENRSGFEPRSLCLPAL